MEDLRTTLQTGLDIEKGIRGATAGFNTPTVVVDAPGGGGKRDAHWYEHYDRTTGVSVYTAPAVHPGEVYCYFDPISLLPPAGQARWADPAEQVKMVDEAKAAAVSSTALADGSGHAAARPLLAQLRVQLRHHARRHPLGPAFFGRVVVSGHGRVHLVEQALGLRGAIAVEV